MFELHPQLKADSIAVGHIGDIACRLVNDSRFPWLILVPEVDCVTEIHQLDSNRQAQLARAAADLGKTLLELCRGDKLNVGALGNVVSQLHYHLVVRNLDDAAWPEPVWGSGKAVPYGIDESKILVKDIRAAFDMLN